MNLELNIYDLYKNIPKDIYIPTKEKLIHELSLTFSITNYLITNLKKKKICGLEKNKYTNPLLWEYGHVLFFWEHMTVQNLTFEKLLTDKNVYDSFKNKKDFRYINLLSLEEIDIRMKSIYIFLLDYIKKKRLSNIIYYLIRLGQLHQEMHNESFIFSYQVLSKNPFKFNFFNNYNYTYNLVYKNISFINVKKSNFIQGSNDGSFYFDNEKPCFKKTIENFSISKYCITNYQYLEFVKYGGYSNRKLWSYEGWLWKRKNNIKLPLYWKIENSIVYEKVFNKYNILRMNNPVIHISWYEANAFCKWKKCRLPFEHEWEYVAQQSKNPLHRSHLNYGQEYKTNSTISVIDDKNINDLSIVGLFGNCWEWCLEPLYPYDGFKMDPVYREMSYPWFGQRRICRGGSWAVPNFLINKSYRNAQPADCRHQYIGFRVVNLNSNNVPAIQTM